MIHATINTVSADLACGEGNLFRATGSTIANPGFMAVYMEGVDDAKKGDDDEKLLPPLIEGEEIPLQAIRSEQHFTEPPPRYSEASLVKTLEEHGIGRPSTYASIISTLQDREYVELEKKRFHPTDVGRVVNRFLKNYFTKYVDYDFTARLENELDAVSRGEEEWIPLLKQFWSPFKERIDHTQETGQAQRCHPRSAGRGVPAVRQTALHPTRTPRPLRRLQQLPRVRLYPGSQRRQPRAGNTGDSLGQKMPGMRIRSGDKTRQIRKIHRLFQLPEMPFYRAAGKTGRHRRHLSQMQ